jgi:hypothetical protein
MADAALMKLEEMLPEVTYFVEKKVFTEREVRDIMAERRAFEMAVNSRAYTARDFLNYINFEVTTECLRRERYEQMRIKKANARDASIVRHIHDLFNRCMSKFAHDVSIWHKYIEFCASSGSSNALNRVLMRAIKRHPRDTSFRIIAADRELQIGNLIGARKLLMRSVRIRTTEHYLIWQQLFKLECVAMHKLVTAPVVSRAHSTESVAPQSTEEEEKPTLAAPSCMPALVVFRHGLKDLSSNVKDVERFAEFAREAVDSLEMSILGFSEPAHLEELRNIVRD